MLTTSAFLALALQCAPSIDPATLSPIVKTESSFNPYAIAVVGKLLPRQPQSLDEAVTIVKALVKEGANFSIGLGQINRQHFDVGKSEQVFDPCTNLRMTAAVLQDCYATAQKTDPDQQSALRKAISCYYSGNQKRGFVPEPQFGNTSHVQRVLANADATSAQVPALVKGADTDPGKPAAPPPATVPPIYETWDVLRQYPRPAPPVQPAAPAAPKTQVKPPVEETSDDQ
jgi:type IV secretion system protein VirB1